jgi:hypothetical protein
VKNQWIEKSMKIQRTQSLIASVTLRLLEIFEETEKTGGKSVPFQLHLLILLINRISRRKRCHPPDRCLLV